MENNVNAFEVRAYRCNIGNVRFNNLELWIVLVVLKIYGFASAIIVDRDNVEAKLKKFVHQVATDEAGASGD
jgi:hypothetical protein